MKRRILFLIMLALILTSVPAFTESDTGDVTTAAQYQPFDFIKGTVTATQLNVRQGPSTKFNIVRVLKKGQDVKIFGKIGEWYAVYEIPTGCVGAVHSKYIDIGGATPASVPAGETEANESEEPASKVEDVSRDEQELLALVNEARKDAGVEPLQLDANLLQVARLKAKDMADNNYFSHQSAKYGTPFDMMRKYDVSFKTAGENIAGNQTVEGAFNAWIKSEGHKKNILNSKFSFTGIGVVEDKTYGKIIVQQFIGK